MINEKNMIKKLQEKIKNNTKLFNSLEIELKKEESKNNPNETFISDTMQMLVTTDIVNLVYKDLIKKIKKGEFDATNLIS